MKQKHILLICLAIIIVVAACVALYLNSQVTTQLTPSNSNITNGDNFTVTLTSENGEALANQTVTLTIINQLNETNNYTLVTDSSGAVTLIINMSSGNYTINGVFNGNGHYKGSNFTQSLIVTEPLESNSQSSSASGTMSSFEKTLEAFENSPNPDFETGIITKPDGSKWVVTGDREAPYGSAEGEDILNSAMGY